MAQSRQHRKRVDVVEVREEVFKEALLVFGGARERHHIHMIAVLQLNY